jgi:hypothetical protein
MGTKISPLFLQELSKKPVIIAQGGKCAECNLLLDLVDLVVLRCCCFAVSFSLSFSGLLFGLLLFSAPVVCSLFAQLVAAVVRGSSPLRPADGALLLQALVSWPLSEGKSVLPS